jgi:phosphatidylglycerophosphatase A
VTRDRFSGHPNGDQPRGAESTPIWREWDVLLTTGLGVGFAKWMPGTIGALWGLPLAWLLAGVANPYLQLFAVAALWLLGVRLSNSAAPKFGKKDPGAIVCDEFVTLPLVYFPCERPLLGSISFLVLGFLLHRAFDITKPPPARQLESLPGGWGIMSDDVVAALYAWSAMFLLRLSGFWPQG